MMRKKKVSDEPSPWVHLAFPIWCAGAAFTGPAAISVRFDPWLVVVGYAILTLTPMTIASVIWWHDYLRLKRLMAKLDPPVSLTKEDQ